MLQENYNIFKNHFKRKELRAIHYHVTWFSRYFSLLIMQYREYPNDCIIPPMNLVYYASNMLIRSKNTILAFQERPVGGGLSVKTVEFVMPEKALFGNRTRKSQKISYMKKMYRGFDFIGRAIGNIIGVMDDSILVKKSKKRDGWLVVTLTHGAAEVLIKLTTLQESRILNQDFWVGMIRVPHTIYNKRYFIYYPASAWPHVTKITDLIALSYLNTLFINSKRDMIAYDILYNTLMKYMPLESYYYKNKRALIKQMNKFCIKLGLPELFEYKDGREMKALSNGGDNG